MRCFGGLKVAAAIIFIVALPFNAMSQTAKEYYEKGKAIKRELERASYDYRRSKEGKDAHKKANELFIKACELDTELCKEAEHDGYDLSLNGETYGIGKRIDSIYEKKCFSGEAKACYLRVGDFYNGMDKDDVNLAAKFHGKGCELGYANSCANLGKLTERGGTPKDQRKALLYYEKACELGNGKDCIRATDIHAQGSPLLGIPANADKLVFFAQKACDRGETEVCEKLAVARVGGEWKNKNGETIKITKDPANAVAYWEKEIKEGRGWGISSPEGVGSFFAAYVALGGWQDGLLKFQNLCGGDFAVACSTLSVIYAKGSPENKVKQDYRKALTLSRKGCEKAQAAMEQNPAFITQVIYACAIYKTLQQ